MRGGHRSSAIRMIGKIYEVMESTDEVEAIITKLKQCKLALQEKIETVKSLDEEILELVDDDDVENEIEQADTFKERVQRAIIDSTRALETRETVRTTRVTTGASVEGTAISSPTTPTTLTAAAASTTITGSDLPSSHTLTPIITTIATMSSGSSSSLVTPSVSTVSTSAPIVTSGGSRGVARGAVAPPSFCYLRKHKIMNALT